MFVRSCRISLAIFALIFFVGAAQAQRANDNAVSAADDAFGTTVGNESTGLYSSGNARGFSPQSAGNVRIEGLFFDNQGGQGLTGRLFAGNTIHVGISAQSYPFPAPTGIANFRLRIPGEQQVISVFAGFGPYDEYSVELDTQTPLISQKLSLGVGLGFKNTAWDWGSHSWTWSAATILRWQPTDNIEVIPFWSQSEVSDWEVRPFIFTAGPFLPPKINRRTYFSQDWADWEENNTNFGVITRVNAWDDWTVRLGLFRSLSVRPENYLLFYSNTQPDGSADLSFFGQQDQRFGSYSGELRASRIMVEGPRRHTVHISAKGRNIKRQFDGTSIIPFGPAQIGVEMRVPRPDFVFGEPDRNTTRQGTVGATYEAFWQDVGEFSIGLQKTWYKQTTAQFGLPEVNSRSNPWLYNATMAIYVTNDLALYGSYTRGLEESGVAPDRANNRGEAVPASITEQVDAGLRYSLTPRLTLVAGVFEVKKPFIETDAANVFGKIGSVRHRGIELSLAGEPTEGLTVVAGTVLLQARVSGPLVEQGVIGHVPFDRNPRVSNLNIQYGPASWKGLSIEAQVSNIVQGYADSANLLKLDPKTFVDLGLRYKFDLFDAPAQLRLRAQNITNTYGWGIGGGSAAWYSYAGPTRFSISLAADF